jgi:CubicO group peptidase (beta-lactamase class C family)
MTSIAALQCVEKGKLQLDEDVTPILPELKNIDILKGFDDEGKPITVKATKMITLRSVTLSV